MRRHIFFFLVLTCAAFTSCLNGEVITLNYKNTLTTTFIIPDSVKADTTYILNAEPLENPIAILLDSFKVSSSTIQSVLIDTAFVKVSTPNSFGTNLNFLDTLTLFYMDGSEVKVGAIGSFEDISETGFKVQEGISLHSQLLNDDLRFTINGFSNREVKDSVLLEFTLNLSITGEAK